MKSASQSENTGSSPVGDANNHEAHFFGSGLLLLMLYRFDGMIPLACRLGQERNFTDVDLCFTTNLALGMALGFQGASSSGTGSGNAAMGLAFNFVKVPSTADAKEGMASRASARSRNSSWV